MENKLKTEYIDKLISLSQEDLKKVFEELSLSEIEDLISKINEEVE